MIEVEYVGGIVNAGMWLEDGKNLSRNFRQGNRVYSEEGLATSLTAQSVGGLGGNTSLYLVDTNKRKEGEKLIRQIGYVRKNVQGNRVYDVNGVGATLASQTGGLGGKGVSLIMVENKRNEGETLTNTQSSISEFMSEEETVEKKPFKYISLFAGIGGFDFGLNAVGGECVFASEIDKFAKQAYTTLHGIEPHGDITKIDAKDVPDHDVIAAGFPCQSFSVAGKRGGFEDARGTLFFEVARIASEKQPKVLLLENVKGLVGHDKGKTLDTIVKTLNEIGYRVDFEVLNSKYFGVPQNRERIFIVAIREDLVANDPWNIVGNTVVPKGKRRISGYEDVKTFNFDWPTNDTVEKRLVDVLESEVSEKFYLDEEKTRQLVISSGGYDSPTDKHSFDSLSVKSLGNVNPSGNGMNGEVYSVEAGLSPTLTTNKGEGSKIAEGLPQVLSPKRNEYGKAIRRKYESGELEESRHNMTDLVPRTDGISNTLTTVLKDNWLAENSPELKIKEATKKGFAVASEGDAVNIMFPTSKTRRGRVGKEGQAQTLEASGVNQGVVLPELRIRKLTPLECWRLQGFSDEQHNAVEAAGISNSQRYKMAGNAVTISVIEAIGTRLLPYL